MSRPRILALTAAVAAVLLAGVLVLIFGPARGARDDIAAIRGNVSRARGGIYATLHVQQTTLDRLTAQLHALRASLEVQTAALRTARRTGHTVHHIGRGVTAIGRSVSGTAGSLSQVVQTARATEQHTAAILREAELALEQLQQSRQLQAHLLEVAHRTLHQTRQINHKLP